MVIESPLYLGIIKIKQLLKYLSHYHTKVNCFCFRKSFAFKWKQYSVSRYNYVQFQVNVSILVCIDVWFWFVVLYNIYKLLSVLKLRGIYICVIIIKIKSNINIKQHIATYQNQTVDCVIQVCHYKYLSRWNKLIAKLQY